MVGNQLKQSGHPVTPKGIGFIAQEKLYPKEACDVRAHYSILFPLSSNQNYQSNGFIRCQRITYSSSTQQTVPARMSWLRSKSLRYSQLGRTQRSRSEYRHRQSLDYMPYRKLFCPRCKGVRIEDLELFHPYLRVTHRMAHYIYQLCQMMTATEVARHLGMNWKTVKAIDKQFLEHDYGQPDLNGLRIL